jgi:hypothetical protein
VKNNRSITLANNPGAKASAVLDARPAPGNLRLGWTSFWFSAVNPIGLHRLRVLAGLLFLAWLLPLTGHQAELFGLDGWFDRQAYLEAMQLPGGPPAFIGWSLVYLCGSSTALLQGLWWAAMGVIVLFTLGVASRLTAVLTWVLVVSFLASPAASFDADWLLGILAFYLMIGYVLLGQWNGQPSLAGRLLGERKTFLAGWTWNEGEDVPPSYAANLAVRLLQVHFAILIVVSGLHKLQFGDWWAGVGLWYPLHPPFSLSAERVRAMAAHADSTLIALSLAQYIMLAWQLGFPAFAWRRRWRAVLLGGGVVAWAASVLVYGQPLFGPFYLIGCLSYLTPAEWQGLAAGAAGAMRWATGSLKASPQKKVGVRVGTRG